VLEGLEGHTAQGAGSLVVGGSSFEDVEQPFLNPAAALALPAGAYLCISVYTCTCMCVNTAVFVQLSCLCVLSSSLFLSRSFARSCARALSRARSLSLSSSLVLLPSSCQNSCSSVHVCMCACMCVYVCMCACMCVCTISACVWARHRRLEQWTQRGQSDARSSRGRRTSPAHPRRGGLGRGRRCRRQASCGKWRRGGCCC